MCSSLVSLSVSHHCFVPHMSRLLSLSLSSLIFVSHQKYIFFRIFSYSEYMTSE